MGLTLTFSLRGWGCVISFGQKRFSRLPLESEFFQIFGVNIELLTPCNIFIPSKFVCRIFLSEITQRSPNPTRKSQMIVRPKNILSNYPFKLETDLIPAIVI